ncbi:hypothetical protein GCM10027048_33490 [Hymenobacter coalescens]
MLLRPSARYLLAFALAVLVFTELHELAHLSVLGRVCGCFGPRDFNEWQSCATCAHPALSYLATAAGPLFSYLMMWLGVALLGAGTAARRSLGFTLIFANLPFARLFTALLGGGDELTIVRTVFADSIHLSTYRVLMTAVVAALSVPPMLLAYRRIRNPRPWRWLLGFAVGPLLFEFGYLFQLMNGLLHRGLLAEPWALGTPALIWGHTALCAVLLLALRRAPATLEGGAERPLQPVGAAPAVAGAV